MRSRWVVVVAAVTIGLVAAAGGIAGAQEPREPFAVEGSGELPIDDETRLVVEGVAGEIFLQKGKAGQLRFLSQVPKSPKLEVPLALHASPGVVRLAPPVGREGQPCTLQVLVPPELAVTVRPAEGAIVTASGLSRSIEIRGRRLKVAVRGGMSDVEVENQDGEVVVESTNGGAIVRGARLTTRLNSVAGPVYLSQEGGQVDAARLRGGFDADLDAAPLKLVDASGSVRVRARESRIEVERLGEGGHFDLALSPITLMKSKGEIDVTSDGDVQFSELAGALHFDIYGGSLRGAGNEGLVEVRTRNATIQLDRIAGPVRAQGDGLKIGLKEVAGEVYLLLRGSELLAESIVGDLTVENDTGDITVKAASAKTTIKSGAGTVRLSDLTGSAVVEARDDVDVGWSSLPGQGDSLIKAESGKVTARFPINGTARIEARSKYGRVAASGLPKVQILEEGAQAQGFVNHTGARTLVQIEAGGDVELIGSGPGRGESGP